MTLAEFLLARIAEDDEAARRASDECARLDRDFDVENPGEWRRWSHPAASITARGPVAEFVDRQTPERAIAEAEAKRQIIFGCTRELENWVRVRPGVRENRPARTPWPEDDTAADVLTYMALAYADHPEYDPEWKP